MSLNVCVIGAGAMGANHARAWAARSDARVVAISDLDQVRTAALARELDAKPFSDFKEAIAYEPVQVISICTPTFLHAPITCFAAEHGRHILTEKPLSLTIEEGVRMIDAAREHNVKLAVSMQYRDMWCGKCAQLIRQGATGTPITLHFNSVAEVRPKVAMHRQSHNGGPVIDMACHFFDLMRFLTGAEPLRVFARGHVYGKGKPRLKEVKDFAIDAAAILVEYDDGHILNFAVNWGMPEGFPGYNEQFLAGPLLTARPDANKLVLQFGDHQERWDVPPFRFPPERRIADLVEAIRDDRDPEITGEDALIALRVSLAALESINTGRVVELADAAAVV